MKELERYEDGSLKFANDDKVEQWYGRRGDGTWYIMGLITGKQASKEMKDNELFEICTDKSTLNQEAIKQLLNS